MNLNKILIAAVVAMGAMAPSAFAQVSDVQTFQVLVPSSISILAPTPLVTDTHDGSDGDFAFLPQLWNVRGNVSTGVTVDFTVDGPFVHVTDNTQVRDAQLTVASPINVGASAWSLASGSNSVATAGTGTTGTVTYSTTGPSTGDFAVTVAFKGGTFGTFLAGVYETTVTGTVTQNP